MLSERSPAARESSFQGIRYGKFSEGSQSLLKKNELTEINSLG